MLYRNITLLPNITEVESVETVEASLWLPVWFTLEFVHKSLCRDHGDPVRIHPDHNHVFLLFFKNISPD